MKESLCSLTRELAGWVPKQSVKWVRPEQFHLTLRFIGNVAESEVPALVDALGRVCARAERLTLKTSELGCFPNRRVPRVIWVGLSGDLDALAHLAQRVARETSHWGKVEEGAFHPHLTLGRFTGRDRMVLQELGNSLAGRFALPETTWRSETLHLIQSRLSPTGAQYTLLASIPLASVFVSRS